MRRRASSTGHVRRPFQGGVVDALVVWATLTFASSVVVDEVLATKDKVLTLPVLQHAERLQSGHYVVGVHCCLLTQVC